MKDVWAAREASDARRMASTEAHLRRLKPMIEELMKLAELKMEYTIQLHGGGSSSSGAGSESPPAPAPRKRFPLRRPDRRMTVLLEVSDLLDEAALLLGRGKPARPKPGKVGKAGTGDATSKVQEASRKLKTI